MTNFEKWRQGLTIKDYIADVKWRKYNNDTDSCRACPALSVCRNDVGNNQITCTERLMMFALMEADDEK
jgi:hypothetical protein